MTTGFRIRTTWDRISSDIVESFKSLPVANVSDSMSRMTAGGAQLRPMHASGGLSGPAFTVKTRPGDNLLLHKAIEMAQPGDVIVVDAGGDTTNSLMGELMLTRAIKRGVGGFVLYGSIRDADEIRRINLPVFALGATHRGPYKDGPGEIGLPIAIDGMVIEAGDLLLGDGDGVLAVPRHQAETILAATQKKHAAEARQLEQTQDGSIDRSWIDRALEAKGCEYIN